MVRKAKQMVNLLTIIVILIMFLLPFFKTNKKRNIYRNKYHSGANDDQKSKHITSNWHIDSKVRKQMISKMIERDLKNDDLLVKIDLNKTEISGNNSNSEKQQTIKTETIHRLFFVDPSNRGYISPKQACAVESAARAHPHKRILVFSQFYKQRIGVISSLKSLKALREFKNVRFKLLNVTTFGKRTVFSDLGSLIWNQSKFRDKHIVDLLKLLILYKYGGIYLDLDVVVARPLDVLGTNFIGFEDEDTIGPAVIAASNDGVGASFIGTALRDFKSNYKGDLYDYNGRDLLMRTLRKICTTNETLEMSADKCFGFEVYKPKFFNPVQKDQKQRYMETEINYVFPRYAYVYHTWETNKTQYSRANVKNCPFLDLVKKYCPTVYEYCIYSF